MRKLPVALPLIIFLFFVANNANSQINDSILFKYEDQFPKEKMHIHFDKAIYNFKETIFYKLYVLEGNDLSTLSKNVYVAWYDTSGNLIKQTVAPLIQSTASGSFDLPSDYTGNFIHLKAFTRWMLNDDSAFHYEKYIPINTGRPKNKIEKVHQTKVEFFPEGGTLVNGLKTKIAFKAVNEFGAPVEIKAVLQNSKNEILDSINVAHDGMGFFNLKPMEEESYHLSWTDENLIQGITPIHSAQKEGVTLSVTTGYKKAYVQLERTKNVPNNFKHLKLLVHQNQHLLYSVDFKKEEFFQQKIGLNIDTFPTGIIQFSLFTSDWLPIAERILFVNNHLPEFDANVSFVTTDLNKRGKNNIEIQVTDSADANMSIAITDASIVIPEQQNIFSDFLLSNEIRGKVNNPAYYFSSDADSVTEHLDLVMLTNGWRKFDWEKLREGIIPKLNYPKETDYMKLSGKVIVSKKTTIPKDLILNVAMQGKDKTKRILVLPVLKDGSFEDKSVIIYDTAHLTYSFNNQTNLTQNSQVRFNNNLISPNGTKITNDYLENWSGNFPREKLNDYLGKQEFLRNQIEVTTLKEVVVKTTVKSRVQLLEEEYPSALFKGGNAISFDLGNDVSAQGAINILDYLKSKISNLLLNNNSIFFLDDAKLEGPAVLNVLESVPITSIAYIKIFRPPFVGVVGGGNGAGASIPGGIVSIYTKHESSTIEDPRAQKLVEKAVLTGYTMFKEFYNPNYENQSDNSLSDNRTTLYWNPYVLTNASNKKVNISFYNNDRSKKLQIILEGFNINGKLTRVVKYLE